MSKISCYNIVSSAINDACDSMCSGRIVNKNKQNIIKRNCVELDKLLNDFNGMSLSAVVDKTTTDITVSIVCGDIIIDHYEHYIYNILQDTKKFTIKTDERTNSLCIEFTFPGVWQ